MSKRVLIVTPVFPMPETGADEADRAGGIRQLKRIGYEVTVIAKIRANADTTYLQSCAAQLGIRLITVPYRYSNRDISRSERIWNHLGKLRNPLYLDGAAYEYAEPVIQGALTKEIERERPDIVWFDNTHLWPLYHIVRRWGIPIITRPENFEPTHFLEEDGRSFINYLKYLPKLLSELLVIWKSDLIVALSPYEAHVYRRWGARHVAVVPLRGLTTRTRNAHTIRSGPPLHVFFMGSKYSVRHNERALDFITGYLAPRAEREAPGAFVFHISGAKVPKKYESRFDGVHSIREGYIDADKFDAYLDGMDIAISSSPKKVGMQQKVYEPLCRGVPLITNVINTGGYPFNDGEHFLAAESDEEYFQNLLRLRDPALRARLSKNSIEVSSKLFSREENDSALKNAIRTYLKIEL